MASRYFMMMHFERNGQKFLKELCNKRYDSTGGWYPYEYINPSKRYFPPIITKRSTRRTSGRKHALIYFWNHTQWKSRLDIEHVTIHQYCYPYKYHPDYSREEVKNAVENGVYL